MLPRKDRFSRAEFADFSAQPGLKTTYNKLGTLKYTLSGHKFAVVTSGKHEKRAVARNKLRRRVYSLFQDQKTPFSGILFASKQSYSFENKDIKTLYTTLLSHATGGK
jgi:ribonuclease P protein component